MKKKQTYLDVIKWLYKEEKMLLLVIVVALVLVATTIQNAIFPIPDHKVDDCIAYYYESSEFLPARISPSFGKILKVGRRQYLMMPLWRTDRGIVTFSKKDPFDEVSIANEHRYVKVNCFTGAM